jgi:hypothetical protein
MMLIYFPAAFPEHIEARGENLQAPRGGHAEWRRKVRYVCFSVPSSRWPTDGLIAPLPADVSTVAYELPYVVSLDSAVVLGIKKDDANATPVKVKHVQYLVKCATLSPLSALC